MNFGTHDEELAMKRYIVSMLVKQAQSDNHFSNIEKKYLAHVSKSLRLSDAEVAAVRHDPEAFQMKPPPDEPQRMTIFYYLLFMMRADQQITTAEEQLCYQIGFKLGFREDMIGSLVGLMRECLHKQIPPDGMLERIKPYLN